MHQRDGRPGRGGRLLRSSNQLSRVPGLTGGGVVPRSLPPPAGLHIMEQPRPWTGRSHCQSHFIMQEAQSRLGEEGFGVGMCGKARKKKKKTQHEQKAPTELSPLSLSLCNMITQRQRRRDRWDDGVCSLVRVRVHVPTYETGVINYGVRSIYRCTTYMNPEPGSHHPSARPHR